MSDKSDTENYTYIALKKFQCSIPFCYIEFQSCFDFSVSFSATNFHSVCITSLLSCPGYRAAVLHSLTKLKVLDGLDRNGRPVVKDGDLDDIPGKTQSP